MHRTALGHGPQRRLSADAAQTPHRRRKGAAQAPHKPHKPLEHVTPTLSPAALSASVALRSSRPAGTSAAGAATVPSRTPSNIAIQRCIARLLDSGSDGLKSGVGIAAVAASSGAVALRLSRSIG